MPSNPVYQIVFNSYDWFQKEDVLSFIKNDETHSVVILLKHFEFCPPVSEEKNFKVFFYTLFSPSSDIQRIGEGHPSACLTNYSKGILWLIVTLAHHFHAPFMHFQKQF